MRPRSPGDGATRGAAPRAVAVLLAAAAAALAGGASPATGPTSNGYLVWLDGGDAVETHWIVAGEDGRPEDLGHADAVVIAAGGGLWAWRTTPYRAPACRCGDVEPVARAGLHGATTCPDGDAGEWAGVTDLLRGTPVTLVPPRADEADGRRSQGVTLVGAVGPLLLLQVDVTEEFCEGPPTTASRAVVFDLASGEFTDLIGAAERGRIGVRERVTALRALQRDGVILDAAAANDLRLTQMLPRYTPDGLEVLLQYTAPACFACPEDGLWSSGTRSERVAAVEVPAALAAHAAVPAVVREFVRGAGADVRRFGFSTPGPELDREAALRALVRGPVDGGVPPDGDRAGGSPASGAALSGRYESASGALDLLVTRDGVVATYRTVLTLDRDVEDICDCGLAGGAHRQGYLVDPVGTMLIPTEGRIRLTGPAPRCCSPTWPGDDLARVGDLVRCEVAAERARFYDDEALTSPTRAFVMRGDSVEIVTPWAGLAPDAVVARYRGDVASTTGFLPREALRCP